MFQSPSRFADFAAGFKVSWPMVLGYVPLAMLWGTLASAKGFTPLDALLMSFFVYAGASQFIAVDMWKEPLPVFLLVATAFIVNLRHFLMAASISRHINLISKWLQPLMIYVLTDEAWAIAERKAQEGPLSLGYYLGVALPLWPTWFLFSGIGAWIGQSFGNLAALGDFGLAAMFITIITGFWKGSRTGAVIGASALVALFAKLHVPGQWFILLGGLAGVIVAALLHNETEESSPIDAVEEGMP